MNAPFDAAAVARGAVEKAVPRPDPDLLANPDMTVLRLNRRPPPPLPLHVFGPDWQRFIEDTAKSAACPSDYVAAPLLAVASALIGNARWAQANEGWAEPPHLWCGVVGDSGSGKSPGADALMRHVLPEIERRMLGDFPDRKRDWQAASEAFGAAQERWKAEVRKAQKEGVPPPLPPSDEPPPEPQEPRLRQTDVTVEKVANLLANAAQKGLVIVRDELVGWLTGMNAYNEAGRAFWIEAYGGRPYRVERMKHPEPIEVPHLAVAVTGGTQPEKLAELMRSADDGLLARIGWYWPEPVPFALANPPSLAAWATEALDRLRELDLAPSVSPGTTSHPIMVPLVPEARPLMEEFGRKMQDRQEAAAGLMRSAFGKARGTALRVALVLEHLRWCGRDGFDPPPTAISVPAFLAACCFVDEYLMPMAERVYGDAATPLVDRNAATLARWIIKERAAEVHVRRMIREVRLPGLNNAEFVRAAAAALIDAGWLFPPEPNGGSRPRAAYRTNPNVWAASST